MRKLPRNRLLAIGAVVLAAAAGGGAAVAGAAGGGSPSDFMDSVAKHLGISRDKLDEATKAAAKDQVDAALKAGKITQAQADEAKKHIDAGDGRPPFGGRGGPGGPGGPGGLGKPGFGFGGHGALKGGLHDGLDAAAKYLGLGAADLRTKLQGGKSLADVAKDQGKDVAGLKDAILASAKSSLDQAVKDQDLTQKVADEIYARLKEHADDLVNGKPGDRPRFRDHGGPGPFGP